MQEHLLSILSPTSANDKALATSAIVLSLAGAAWLVYSTGGVKFATLHIMYLPLILGALVFGTRGGVLAGLVGGLLLGPYMPLDTATGEAQQLHNWLYRTIFFCMVGGLVGGGASALRRQLMALAWLNDHDVRTGMLGRIGLLKTLRQTIARSGHQDGLSVAIMHMNNFLEIQNTLGPDFAEKLLTCIAERGRRLVPPDAPIAMIQPDRLAAVFTNSAEAQKLRAEIEAGIREPYQIDGIPVYVDFNIGVARFPDHARTAEELLQKASIAMHTAVTRKRPFFLYDSAADRTSRDNLILLGLVPAALANNEFIIWHQAKFSLATGQISSTEALLRWVHPQRGLVPPGDFIPQVEETALINDLTQWVVHAALADKAAWTARGQSMGIAINLSVRNLRDRALLEALHETTLRHRIDPQRVELEITEGAVMDDFEYCAQLISRLRDRGYRVSVDDFGTGHSSLAYLKKLPVCALKIDQAFVKNLAHEVNDQKIVRAILGLAKSLDLETVAEGVEDDAALALLRDWGCDYAQGFGLHRPAPYAELLAWIEDRHRTEKQ